ncbi:flagellar hook-basal body complex protein [Devosia sp. ZB163]|uniref:flagellar hook protein FlgE n=1 Tax=Devosia sp. ZB163 TaxID=3025938 RepID=UPI002360E075|nr:flagellar hook-basal body complex protein [Devosia sp. ZB163]MDC9824210.1 flagellar hook-basal body complex protein [Devosia sp. ZB163]
MGIYGALSTAVTGLRAQSFALENISGNIANSQTTGFKRIDTDFVDMIPDASQKRQTAGSVLAYSRSTNNLQGDIKGTTTETNMAINGNGFFVVEPAIGMSDGDTLFAGASYYTRRGDFELDKNGYMVNGSGYYLKGLPIDPETQNISGSVPQVLRVSSAFLPAQQTSTVNYELNLPQLPKTAAYQASLAPGSELLRAQDFLNLTPDVPATTSGATLAAGDLATNVASVGDSLTISVNGSPVTINFVSGGGHTGNNVDIAAAGTVGGLLTAIQNVINAGIPAPGDRPTIALNGSGAVTVTAADATDVIQVTDTTTGTSSLGFGLADGTYNPTVSSSVALAARVNNIAADDANTFVSQSISGGAITVYAGNGAPANVQMRWAKVNSTANGGAERWNLFVLTNSAATGAGTAWSRVGGDYSFGADGSPNPPIEYTQLDDLQVNGVLIGDVRLQHGQTGLTQFSDPNGTAEVTTLNQNGYAAGEFVSVAVNDNGRVVVSYTNGQQLEVAQVVTANFNAVNALKRMDGGVFAATSQSGEPLLDTDGVLGSAVEASNTDISEEFTKLIVTQQAYAAGTRIVSAADQMLQESLNMIR